LGSICGGRSLDDAHVAERGCLENPEIPMTRTPEISPDNFLFAENDPENPIILRPVIDALRSSSGSQVS
jgi:hypothetical protein